MLRKVQVFKHMRRQFVLDQARGSGLQRRALVVEMLNNVEIKMLVNDNV